MDILSNFFPQWRRIVEYARDSCKKKILEDYYSSQYFSQLHIIRCIFLLLLFFFLLAGRRNFSSYFQKKIIFLGFIGTCDYKYFNPRVQKRRQEEKARMYLASEGWISGFIFKKYLSCCTWSSLPFLWTVTKGNPFCRVQVFIIFFTSSVLFVIYKKRINYFCLKMNSLKTLQSVLSLSAHHILWTLLVLLIQTGSRNEDLTLHTLLI